MSKKKIYIGGKVTGLNPELVSSKFQNTEIQIELMGFAAVNPIKVVNDPSSDWQPAMRICIKALMDCDAAYFMPCSHTSEGAGIEMQLCENIGMPILFTYEDLAEWNY